MNGEGDEGCLEPYMAGIRKVKQQGRLLLVNISLAHYCQRRKCLIVTFINPLIAHDETVSSYKKTVPVSMKMYSFF